MAKELPYFKFEPNAWENGNIQMLSREDKGLFIDICTMYWSRLGDLPVKLVVQKLCGGNAVALNSLCDEKIIALQGDKIGIKFLDFQLKEFENLSSKNSINAKKRWNKTTGNQQVNATALPNECNRNAIREDKIREDKRREDNNSVKIFNFKKSLLDFGFKENLVSEWLMVRKNKKATNSETAFNKFTNEVLKSKKDINEILELCVTKSWSGFENSYLNSIEPKIGGSAHNKLTL